MTIIKKKSFLNSKTKNIKNFKNYKKQNDLNFLLDDNVKINIENENKNENENKRQRNIYLLNRCCLDVTLFAFFLNKLYFIFLSNFFSNFYTIPEYNYYLFLGLEVILFWVYLYLIKNLSFIYTFYMLLYNFITIAVISFFFSKTLENYYNFVKNYN